MVLGRGRREGGRGRHSAPGAAGGEGQGRAGAPCRLGDSLAACSLPFWKTMEFLVCIFIGSLAATQVTRETVHHIAPHIAPPPL